MTGSSRRDDDEEVEAPMSSSFGGSGAGSIGGSRGGASAAGLRMFGFGSGTTGDRGPRAGGYDDFDSDED